KVSQPYQLLIFGRKLVYKELHELRLLHADGLLLGVEVFILDVKRNGLAVVVGEGVVDTKGIEFFLANKVDGVVRGDSKQPRTERIIFFEAVQASEGLGKRFDGEVFRVVDVSDHLKDHVIHRTTVTLQKP